MNCLKEAFIRKFCSAFNGYIQATDDRPVLSNEDCESIRRKLAGLATFGRADYEVLVNFFAEKTFIRRVGSSRIIASDRAKPSWRINTRLDDEWAINLFSEDVESLATGVYKLDDILKGGLRIHRSHTAKRDGFKQAEAISVVLQARPGSGKTTTALLMLSNFACQGYTSVYLSAEQGVSSLRRILRRFCEDSTDVPECPGLSIGTLRTVPESDSIREHRRQLESFKEADKALKADAKLQADIRRLFDHCGKPRDQRKFFLLAMDQMEPITDPSGKSGIEGESFVLPSNITSKIRRLASQGIHGIIIVNCDVRTDEKIDFGEGGVFAPTVAEFEKWYSGFERKLPFSPSWLAIDSVSAFPSLSTRGAVYFLQQAKPNLSKLFLTERVSAKDEQSTDLETSCDMLIEQGERNVQISNVEDSPSNYMQRYLEIKKFRSSPFHRGKHPMAIKSGTVKVYRSTAILLKVTGNSRRETEDSLVAVQKKEKDFLFGLDGLDGPQGLNGSIGPGSFTVLMGPPGTYKTAICSYFLTADLRNGTKHRGKSLLYSFIADERAILNGMKNFVDGRNNGVLRDEYLRQDLLQIHDMKPGYMFPEAFVEDLLDTLAKEKDASRIVFDSFDAIQAAYPIMRMDQFFWKVISQICWDKKVSALLKVSIPRNASPSASEAAASLVGIADNIIETSSDGKLRILATEHKIHNSRLMDIEPTMIRKEPSAAAKVHLQVR